MLATVFVCSRLIRSTIKPPGKTKLKLMGRFPIIFGMQDFFFVSSTFSTVDFWSVTGLLGNIII